MKKKKAVKKQKKKIIIFSTLFIFLVSIGVIYFGLGKINKVDIKQDDESLGINQEVKKKAEENDIVNIAFFGIDRRTKTEPCRSDSIIIVSIDKKHNKIKMSSIIRDTYVPIDGHGKTKINHAYAYGGPQLAISTLNKNFALDIKDFVAVDFFDLEKIIDILGGVEIHIENDELKYINDYINSVSNIEKVKATPVTSVGMQTLNGKQAVAYSRIRYTSGGDFKRAERQREVLEQLLNKVKKMDKAEFVKVVPKLLQYVQTSMSSTEIVKMGTDTIVSGMKNIEQARFPVDADAKGEKIDGVYYYVGDLKATTDKIHKFIFDDVKPQ